VRWQCGESGLGELIVTDTGRGIAREHLSRLTERFYRVDGSRSRESGGTGLGLAIVKHVAQRHGGELDVESELGKGATFRLIFPAARVRGEPGPPAAEADADSGVEAAPARRRSTAPPASAIAPGSARAAGRW
jgi:two-component system phosphate regulon sensor histidine kinase PhoR